MNRAPVIATRRRWGGETQWLLLVTLAALGLFLYGLGGSALWDQDETKYTQVAVEILATRDPFTLRFNGEPWFVHPPLFMWLQAATGWAFGFTEFTARIWSAISGAAAIAVTFLLGRFLYDAHVGLAAAIVLTTMVQFFAQARLAIFDPTLLAFMLASFYMFLVARATGSARAAVWAWAWAGLATATKGPIGLLLPAMVMVALALTERRLRLPHIREVPWLGLALFALIGLHWYVIETVRHGLPFLRTAVGRYLVGRFFGVVENQPGPWWYYVPVVLAGAFPWTGFLIPSLAYHSRRRLEPASRVILLWIGVTLVFYSAAGTKLPNYVLPVYPLVAIALGRLCVGALRQDSADAPRLLGWGFALAPIGAVALLAVAAFAAIMRPAEIAALRTELLLIVAVLAAGPLAAVGCFLARRERLALGMLAATIIGMLPVVVHRTLPALEAYRPLPRLAQELREQLHPEDRLAAVALERASLVYYTQRRVIWIRNSRDLDRALCRPGRLFVVVPEPAYRAWVAPRLRGAGRQQGADGPYRILLAEGRAVCARCAACRPGS